MKNIYLIATSIIIALFLSACGEGDSASFTGSTSTSSIITIPIPMCEDYVNILTGDTVVQDETGTTIKTVFNTDGSKKVCVLTGSAHIIRQ